MIKTQSKGVIYEVKNVKTGTTYIGKTMDFEARISNHLSSLRAGTHSNKNLQLDYDMFAEEDFVFNIITEKDENLLKYYEKKIMEEKKKITTIHNINDVKNCDEDFLLEIIEKDKVEINQLIKENHGLKESVEKQLEIFNIKISNLGLKNEDTKLVELVKNKEIIEEKGNSNYLYKRYSLLSPFELKKMYSEENIILDNLCGKVKIELFDRVTRLINRNYGQIIKIKLNTNSEKIDRVKFVQDNSKLDKFNIDVKLDYVINTDVLTQLSVTKRIKI